MWKKVYELLEQLVTLAQRVSRHDKQIDELRQEVRELTGMIHRLAIEANRLADRQASDREKTELWVENQMLRFERGFRRRILTQKILQKTDLEIRILLVDGHRRAGTTSDLLTRPRVHSNTFAN